MSTQRDRFTFKLHGVEVDVVRFGDRQFYYPQLGDREFRATSKGFRDLSHFIRTSLWMRAAIM